MDEKLAKSAIDSFEIIESDEFISKEEAQQFSSEQKKKVGAAILISFPAILQNHHRHQIT